MTVKDVIATVANGSDQSDLIVSPPPKQGSP